MSRARVREQRKIAACLVACTDAVTLRRGLQLAKVPVFQFKGTNTDLGTACGKFFRVSMLGVIDAGSLLIVERLCVVVRLTLCCATGDSDLLKSLPK